MDPEAEKRLSAFLDHDEQDRAHGFTLEKLYERVTLLAEGFATHLTNHDKWRSDEDIKDRSYERRFRSLEAAPGTSNRPPAREASIPPVRDPAQSIAEVKQFAGEVVKALKEGAELQDTTPEQKLEEVVEAQIKKKELQAELEAARAAAATAEQTRKDRRKMWSGAAVTLGVAVLLRVLEVLSRGHW